MRLLGNWPAWAVLVFCAATAGTVYAQSAEEGEEAPGTAGAAGLTFPEFQPGYYRETVRMHSLGGAIPPEELAEFKRSQDARPQTGEFCAGTAVTTSRHPPWRGNLSPDHECQLVAASLDGTIGQGEFRCVSTGARGRMAYSGEFHETSARFTFDGRIAFKDSPGPITFKMDVEITRLADQCPEEPEGAAG